MADTRIEDGGEHIPGAQPRHRPKGEWTPLNDPLSSMAADYRGLPTTQEAMEQHGVQTAFRTERLGDLTYTQFLILVREGHVEAVTYNDGMRTLDVTTRPSCPGRGRVTERVGMIYDPDLYDTLCAHGVDVAVSDHDKMAGVQAGIVRLFAPLLVTVMVIGWSLTLGRAPDLADPLFGGARMELINSRDVTTTFADVAGIDDIKAEIMEVVSFLRDQDRYLALGARAPAGVLLCGPPGMGKTLLAKAIAGEAGVPFFNSSGADFSNMFVGVGAARVRDMFDRARKNAPCILFIDEFDGVGQARSQNGSGNEENVQTINQLLTEMDGFDDNTGLVVLAATNRPKSLDEALTRPGRFDRVITIPYPNLAGRKDILRVHSRDKVVDPAVNYHRVARATAGFSGAELMNLMNTAAIEAVRMQRQAITEDDVFAALEKIHTEKYGVVGNLDAASDDGLVTPLVRRTIATYMAAKALAGLATPQYDELQRVVVTPGGAPTGYAYFIPQDAHLESEIVTRSFMEAHLVVCLAGRVAEQAVMGAANITTAGAADLTRANALAREMIFRCGWSPSLGPVSITEDAENMLASTTAAKLGNMGPATAGKALLEIQALVAAAEAKAYFGLVTNWELLQAMVDRLMAADGHTLSRLDVEELVAEHPVVEFVDCYTHGFGFGEDYRLQWPASYAHLVGDADDTAAGRRGAVPIVMRERHAANPDVHPLNPYQPGGAYVPMATDLMGASDLYFKPEVWSYRIGGDEGDGAATTNGVKADAAEPVPSAAS